MREQRPAEAVPTIPALDGIRGYAALAIVLFHCLHGAGYPSLGCDLLRFCVAGFHLAVDLFFVLSGFVMLLPLTLARGEVRDVRAFAIRRACRLLPAYMATLGIAAAGVAWFPQIVGFVDAGISPPAAFLIHALFLQNFVRVASTALPHLGHLWSLGVEATFYLALPWLGPIFWKRPLYALIAAFAIGLAWRAIGAELPTLLSALERSDSLSLIGFTFFLQLPNYLAHFAAGMVGALLYRSHAAAWVGDGRAIAIVQGLSLAALIASAWWAGSGWLAPRLFFNVAENLHVAAIGGVFVWSTAVARTRLSAWLSNGFSGWLGEISYPLYLLHLFFVHIGLLYVVTPGSNLAFVELLAFVVPTSFLTAWASDRYLERPVRDWARRWERSRASRSAAGASAPLLARERARAAVTRSPAPLAGFLVRHPCASFFAVLTLFYLAFTPGTVRGQGYNEEIVLAATHLADNLWKLVSGHPSGPWPFARHGMVEPFLQLPLALVSPLFFPVGVEGTVRIMALMPLLSTALLGTLIFACARRFCDDDRWSLAVASSAAVGTMLWPYAFIGLETSQSLALMLAAWIVLARDKRYSPGEVIAFASACAVTLTVKQTSIILLPPVAFLVFLYLRPLLDSQVARYVRAAVIVLGLIGLVAGGKTLASVGRGPLEIFFVHDPMLWPLHWVSFFTSPNKSLFVFAPMTALAVGSFGRAYRREPSWTAFAVLTLGSLSGAFALTSVWSEETWGPRYLHSAIAPLAVCLAASIRATATEARDAKWRPLLAVAIVGAWISFLGATFYYGNLHGVAVETGNNRLRAIQYDPDWNHVRFNTTLLHVWVRKVLPGRDPESSWPKSEIWWFTTPKNVVRRQADLRHYAAPQAAWAEALRPGGNPVVAAFCLAAFCAAVASWWRLWRMLGRARHVKDEAGERRDDVQRDGVPGAEQVGEPVTG